jgi:timeless
MTNPMSCSEAFTEDDWKLVQLVFTLFRNVLAIQEIPLQQKAGSASQFLSLRDRYLELLFHENVMDLIIVITQHVGGSYGYFRQDNLLLLEIFHYIFMGQEPESTAKTHLKGFKVGFLSSISTLFYGNKKLAKKKKG